MVLYNVYKDELKNWQWACYPSVYHYQKKSYNSLVRVFTAQRNKQRNLNLWLNKIWVWHQSESDASILCLPSGWFLEHLVEGSQAWIQQDTLSQKKSLSECIGLFWISQGIEQSMSRKCKSWSAAAAAGEEWDIIKWSCNLWMCNLPRTNI